MRNMYLLIQTKKRWVLLPIFKICGLGSKLKTTCFFAKACNLVILN